MPKLSDRPAFSGASTVSAPRLRVLAALSGRGAVSAARLTSLGAAPSAFDLAEMMRLNWLSRHELDIDGKIEVAWRLEQGGRDVLASSAAPSLNGRACEEALGRRDMPVGALVPWFGSARGQAAQVGQALRGAKWVGIPFCGSLCEVPAILAAGCTSLSCNDAHRLLINLARVSADSWLGVALAKRLRRQPYCEELLREAQRRCATFEDAIGSEPDLDAAFWYFIAAWAGRSAAAGTSGELTTSFSIRWTASGGDSALRFSGAAWSIRTWRKVLQRCTLTCLDAFDFLDKCKDLPAHAIYSDPPWPGPGDSYKISFGPREHERLEQKLRSFERARVVVRSGDDEQTRRLYNEGRGWRWLSMRGRNQGNKSNQEWLIVRNADAKVD